MSVVLLILKIIGWVLLAVLGLTLLLLTVVLWVPFRYAGNVVYRERFSAHARASWLLGLVQFLIDFGDGQMQTTLKICGIRLQVGNKNDAENESEAGNEPDHADDEKKNDVREPEGISASEDTHSAEDEAEESFDDEEEIAGSESLAASEGSKDEEKNSGKGSALMEKLRHLFVETEYGERALAHALKYTGKILRSVLPNNAEGYIRFGFGEPDVTGKMLAFLCAAFPQKKNGIKLQPEFLEQCFECDVTLEGRLILGWLVILLAVLILNKNVRYVIKQFRSK